MKRLKSKVRGKGHSSSSSLQHNIDDNPAYGSIIEALYHQAIQFLQGNHTENFCNLVTHHRELIRCTDKVQSTLLHSACVTNNFLAVELLVSNGANVNAVDNSGRTPLMDAVHSHADPKLIQCLLQYNAQVDQVSNKRSTIIYYASRGVEGNIRVLKLLLLHLPQRDQVNAINYLIQPNLPFKTALDFAQNPAIRSLLIEYGALTGSEIEIRQRTEIGMSKIGEKLSLSGYTPKHPAILLPGTCSSALELHKSKKSTWVGERIWLDPFKLGMKFNHSGRNAEEVAFLEHMRLEDDGISDPPGIAVRPVEGFHGIDYLIGSGPAPLTAPSVVWGEVLHMLTEIGYTSSNLRAFPYDWRLAPGALQKRDLTFTRLQYEVQMMFQLHGEKVALVGHSQGCKFAQYFLHWAEDTLGKEWIDQHVEMVIALGPPWLGAPKVVRTLLTGDSMGLPTQILLGNRFLVAMSRTFSSCPWLLPFGGYEKCVYHPKTNNGSGDFCEHWQDVLSTYDETFDRFLSDYYYHSPYLFEGVDKNTNQQARSLQFPHVKLIHSIYGVNSKDLPASTSEPGTEVAAYYKKLDKPKVVGNKSIHLAVARDYSDSMSGSRFFVKDGIRKERPLPSLPSGDGTVPYESLSHADKWRGLPGAPEIRTYEFEGVCHRETLLEPPVLSLIGELLCGGTPSEIRVTDQKVHTIFDKTRKEIREQLCDTNGIPYLVSCVINSLQETNSLSLPELCSRPPHKPDVDAYSRRFATYREPVMKSLNDVYPYSRMGMLRMFFHSLDKVFFGVKLTEALVQVKISNTIPTSETVEEISKVLLTSKHLPCLNLVFSFFHTIAVHPVNQITVYEVASYMSLSIFSYPGADISTLTQVIQFILVNYPSFKLNKQE